MKIRRIKINGFGKLRNKDIEFYDGINIIYGENEAGKSSLLKFIAAMLYGTSKTKNNKEISDFDRFTPWKTDEFSGKIEYVLDNGKEYEVFREFKKKAPIIYDAHKNDISDTFKKDKNKGINYFYQQTGIDEETFFNTAISEQEGLKLSRSGQNGIVQKISNMVSSGDDDLSFKKSIDKISKKQLEDVGTDRTSSKPINIVNKKIDKLISQKNTLEIYKEEMYDNTSSLEELRNEVEADEVKKEYLKELRIALEKTKVKNAEIDATKNIESAIDEQIDEINRQALDDRYKKDVKEYNLQGFDIAIAICAVFFILMFIFLKSGFKVMSLIAIVPLVTLFFFKKQAKLKNEEMKNNVISKETEIASKLEILKQHKETHRQEVENKVHELSEDFEEVKKYLINKYKENIEEKYFNQTIDNSLEEVVKKLDLLEGKLNTTKFRLHTMEATTKDINSKLEDLVKIDEDLASAEREKEELISLNKSYEIAKECLERAYDEVKENISPVFIENLCEIVSKISNGVYSKVVFDDEEGLKVEIDDGQYVPASRLSIGTIDQMYLSLRLSALNEITEESIPVILDESFAYFDDERLRNIFRYLVKNYDNHQIIILTCSRRELEILKEVQIEHSLIKL